MVREDPRIYKHSLAETIRTLTTGYGFTEADLAEILDVTKRTVTRWKDRNETLSLQKLDVLQVLQYLLGLGKRVLGSAEEVQHWFHSSVHALEGNRPADIIKTESGRRRVENVLCQIEAGVY